MGRLVIKAILAYAIGAMFGASAALLSVEYNWNITTTLFLAMIATMVVDFGILRAEF